MHSKQVIAVSNSAATPEQARACRARAWFFIFEHFDSRVRKKGGASAAPDSALKELDGYDGY